MSPCNPDNRGLDSVQCEGLHELLFKCAVMTESNWFEEAVEKALESDSPEPHEDVDTGEEIAHEHTQNLLAEYAVNYPAVMDEEVQTREGFEKRLHRRWGSAFELFEYFTILNHKSGESFQQRLMEDGVPEKNPLFTALIRLHARACFVSRTVLALMRAGYADGAFSRWRALYEIAVSSQFISKYGEDVATRFLEHKTVADYNEIELYREHREKLGFEPVPEEEWEVLEEQFESKVQEYGAVFKTPYGWADPNLDEDPSRRAVAENVGLDMYEPYFAFASDAVHGGSKGTLYRMGLTGDTQTDLMLSGPSNTGFTDPAQFSVLTLVEVTDALLSSRDGIEWILILASLNELTHEVIAAFDDVRRGLEAEVALAEDKGYTIGGR